MPSSSLLPYKLLVLSHGCPWNHLATIAQAETQTGFLSQKSKEITEECLDNHNDNKIINISCLNEQKP